MPDRDVIADPRFGRRLTQVVCNPSADHVLTVPRFVVAAVAEACHEAGMSDRDPIQPAVPSAPDDTAAIEPCGSSYGRLQTGGQTVDVIEGSYEQTYRIGDTYTTKLFVDMCRSRGLLPYRHPRQHAGTIAVRATLSEHQALWSTFLQLSRQLEARLTELTLAFVREMIPPRPKR